jgi:hypothetical protein
LAGKNNCIDLESGNFWVDGKRDDEWYKPYCQIALHLHQQGYIVFTTSHEVVREYFKEIAGEEDQKRIFVCYPDVGLKKAWINKLWDRWQKSNLDKDWKAWINADQRFEENIRELEVSEFKKIVLETMQYDLEAEIKHAQKWRCK